MGRSRKRYRHRESASSPPTRDRSKRPQSSPTLDPGNHSQQQISKRPIFVSYLDTPNLPPKIKLLCEIVANTPPLQVEKILDDTGIRVSQEVVENVLKLSYGCPTTALKFFRWAGYQLNHNHSPYSWNLVVDMLGKNGLFEAMWDAVKSMKSERLLSLATFASVFSSYVVADRVSEAIMTFEVMDQYSCPRDIVALNSLLSAICREGKTVKGVDFLHIVKDKIRPDADTYAILLEGWEAEGNVTSSRQTFGEMVLEIGWDPQNVPAYDSYLSTLVKGPDGLPEVMNVLSLLREKRCFPGMKFFKIGLEECLRTGNAHGACSLWEIMVARYGCKPNTQMYNIMITLQCYVSNIDLANRLLDEMVCNGVFPDSETYNVLFQFFIKARKFREASTIFTEMMKNEFIPKQANCSAAVKIFLDNGDPYMAIKVWKCMADNYNSDLEETGNLLVVELRDTNMVPEALKYAEDMIDRGIKLNSSTLSRLKQSLLKLGKAFVYEELLSKWKAHSAG